MITELQKKLMQLRLELRDVLKDSNPEDYYRIRELVIESEEILSRHSEEEIPEEEIPKQNSTEFLLEDTKAFDESKLFDMNCCIPNMCNVIAPTGEAIDIRIADGQLKISINTNTPDTPVVRTEEWEKNRFCQPERRIFYHRISLPASTRDK